MCLALRICFPCSARATHKLHGMGCQPQAFAKPVVGHSGGVGLLPQPAPLHRGPKAFSAKQPAGEGWAASTQHASTGAATPWLTQLLLAETSKDSSAAAWPSSLHAALPQTHPGGAMGLGQGEEGSTTRARQTPMLPTPKCDDQLHIFPRKLKR